MIVVKCGILICFRKSESFEVIDRIFGTDRKETRQFKTSVTAKNISFFFAQ